MHQPARRTVDASTLVVGGLALLFAGTALYGLWWMGVGIVFAAAWSGPIWWVTSCAAALGAAAILTLGRRRRHRCTP